MKCTNEACRRGTLKADQAALELPLPAAVIHHGARRFPASSAPPGLSRLDGQINDTALAVVNRVDPLYVSFAVPERHLQAAPGRQQGPMPVQIALPGSKEAGFEGKAKFIDNAVDATTGTIQMKALLDNKGPADPRPVPQRQHGARPGER